MKIAVGMSGGVDSTVAALLLKQQGHEVSGVTMKIWSGSLESMPPKGNTCYGPEKTEDIEHIKGLCEKLAIPFRSIDCSGPYENIVLAYFRQEYRCGRTPNPCIRCNQEIKFGVLPRLARESGLLFDRFATGHYARTAFDPSRRRYILQKGAEPGKDQSYFLYRLSQEQLAGVVFPLGGLRKDEVRRKAKEAGLPVHDKEESQDFYSGHYGDIVGQENRPGDIVDRSGKVIGKHQGIWHYTIGQRKGLRIACAEPLYVLQIDAEKNRIVAGTRKETRHSVFTVTCCEWSGIETLTDRMTVQVKIRSASPEADAVIEPAGPDAVNVVFAAPHSAITPGQSAVFYDNDVVLGGGIIDTVKE